MNDRERRVRDEAYRLWNEAGRPDGEGESFWYEAEKRIEADGVAAPKAKKVKSVKPVVKGAGASGVVTPLAPPSKGAAVDVAPAKPKKSVANDDAPKPGKPGKTKSDKPKPKG
ncbi:MAG: hypothetical protein DI565_06625 [Ancylobacter novellus]|uniref:DUF2934 domain-containing protein n=1 Tax=Ancylobacter novellus TaxID=921 RepID=A0A2W5KMG7_ANCNO|nr:MAG: hypothetical protein DI565_06625 [Ancylobacter novellus]